MTTKIKFECDGCGDEEEKPMNSPIVYPSGWSNVTITISGMSSEVNNGQSSYDLCASCQRQLDGYSNPSSWPRAVRDTRAG